MTPDPDRRLSLLVLDYSNARDDERYFASTQIQFLSLGLAVLGALLLVVKDISTASGVTDQNSPYPSAVVAAMPLVILAFLAIAQYIGAQASLRSFYLRALEREIRATLEDEETFLREALPGYAIELRMLTATELQSSYVSMSSRNTFGAFLRSLTFGALTIVFGGICVYLTTKVPLDWAILMLLFYVPATLVILWDNHRSTIKGRSFFFDQVRQTNLRLGDSLTPSSDTARSSGEMQARSLLSYLLLPRPDDLATKTIFTVAGCGMATYSLDAPPSALIPLALVVVAVDLLAYQARYQWNDIRGVSEDIAAPTAVDRGRLPGGRNSIPASLAVLLLRLGLVGWVAALLVGMGATGTAVEATLWSIPLIFGLAITYEAVRFAIRARGCTKPLWIVLLIVVSAGYPLRFLLGWNAAGRLDPPWLLLGCLSLLGIVFVTPTWVLEAFSYVRGSGSLGLTSRRQTFIADSRLQPKDHLRVCAQWAGWRIEYGPSASNERTTWGKHQKPLTISRMPSTWVIAGALWIGLICGAIPSAVYSSPVSWSPIAALASGVALVGCRFPLWTRTLSGAGGTSLFVGGLVAAAGACWGFLGSPIAPAVAALVAMAAFVPAILVYCFSTLSYHDSRQLPRILLVAAGKLWKGACSLFLGQRISDSDG